MKTVHPDTEYKLIQGLFFVYAFLIMSWIARFPEIKSNLGLNIGEFGTLISTGALGAVVSLLFTGHLVHKYGIKRVILTNIWIMGAAYFLSFALIHPEYFSSTILQSDGVPRRTIFR